MEETPTQPEVVEQPVPTPEEPTQEVVAEVPVVEPTPVYTEEVFLKAYEQIKAKTGFQFSVEPRFVLQENGSFAVQIQTSVTKIS